MSKKVIMGCITILIIIAIGFGLWTNTKNTDEPITIQQISIAIIPLSFTGYTVCIAKQKGFFKDFGLNVQLKKSYSNGKETLSAIRKRETDFAVSSETPFIRAVMKGDKIYALASMITAQKHLGIVARKDRGINSPKDLENKKIGVTMGSNGEYFLDLVLTLNRINKSSIQTVNVRPGQMVQALVDGKVDAITTWNPQKIQAINKLKNQAVVFTTEGIYSPYFIISAQKEYIHSNPQIIKRVMQSLYKSAQYISENLAESKQMVSQFLKIEDDILEEMSATYSFNLALEPSLLLTLEDQTKWANKINKNKLVKLPNYLEYIYTDALKKVAPENVTIIK